MTSIIEIVSLYKSGTPLEQLLPEGADLAWWRANIERIAANQASPKRLKKAKRTRTSRKASKRNFNASSVLSRDVGRAMAEQVRRVNAEREEAEICLTCDNQAAPGLDGYCFRCFNGLQTPDAWEMAEYTGERVILWAEAWSNSE